MTQTQSVLIANAPVDQLNRVKQKMMQEGIIRYPRLFDLVVAEARKKEANRKNKELKPRWKSENQTLISQPSSLPTA